MPIEMLVEPRAEAKSRLRAVLRFVRDTFPVYRGLFDELGITARDISTQDPVSILRALPLIDSCKFDELVRESLQVPRQVIDMESSSGTTGPRKRRVITPADEASETRFLAQLFGECGIGPEDRVACLDTGPLTLMASFTTALELLGVAEAYACCASPDSEATVRVLARMDPTVVITIPSILERYLNPLSRYFGKTTVASLRSVVYVGEALDEDTRSALVAELGLEVFAYFGASETSALGVECGAHDGVHLFTDYNVIELSTPTRGAGSGEIVVTTLNQQGLPLLRYPLKDLVNVKAGLCSCGLPYPRVDITGRTDGTASVLGVKVSYDAIHRAAYQWTAGPGPLEVVLTRNGGEQITLVLPDTLAADAARIRGAVLARETELAYLVGSRFLEVKLDFAGETYFDSRKRTGRLLDRRRDCQC